MCKKTVSSIDRPTNLPYSILLAQIQASSRELLVPFLHLWYGVARIGNNDLPLRKGMLYQLSYWVIKRGMFPFLLYKTLIEPSLKNIEIYI